MLFRRRLRRFRRRGPSGSRFRRRCRRTSCTFEQQRFSSVILVGAPTRLLDTLTHTHTSLLPEDCGDRARAGASVLSVVADEPEVCTFKFRCVVFVQWFRPSCSSGEESPRRRCDNPSDQRWITRARVEDRLLRSGRAVTSEKKNLGPRSSVQYLRFL